MIALGHSRCALCGKVLEEGQEIMGFPAFASIENPEFHRFNDRGAHETCFKQWPQRERFETVIARTM